MLPLYKLDFLSLEQVFKNFHPKEIVFLAFLSTRSFKIVRAVLKHIRPRSIFIDLEIRKSHKLTIFLGSNILDICVSNNCCLDRDKASQNFLEAPKSKFKGIGYSVVNDGDNGISTYWEDENIAVKMLYEYISNLLEKPISDLIYHPKSGNLHLELLESITKHQESLPHACIRFTGPSWLHIDRAMEFLSITQKIILDVPALNFWLPKHEISTGDGQDNGNV